MRQHRYLNVILTVNAVLLTGLLWTQIASTPIFAGTASAQNRTRFATPPTIPNAAKQRNATLNAIRDLKSSVDGLKRQVESGVRVEVTNFEEVKGS